MDKEILLHHLDEVRRYITKKREAEAESLLLKGKRENKLKDILIDGYLRGIDDKVEVHGGDYAINIKIHSLDLTEEQRNFLYEDWDRVKNFQREITDWQDRRNEDPDRADVYAKGRSSGWLYLPDVDVLDRRHRDLHDLKWTHERVSKFRREWENLFESMKESLKDWMDSAENRDIRFSGYSTPLKVAPMYAASEIR